MSAEQPSEEELREALKQLRVEDVLLQTVVTLVNLSGRKLTGEGEEKDLEQARQGIEAVRALLPLCPQEDLGPVRDALSQLQMIYVREAGEGGAPPPPSPSEPEPTPQEKPSSRIWTPPGS